MSLNSDKSDRNEHDKALNNDLVHLFIDIIVKQNKKLQLSLTNLCDAAASVARFI